MNPEKKPKKDFIDIVDEPVINIPKEDFAEKVKRKIKNIIEYKNELTKNDAGPITGQAEESQ